VAASPAIAASALTKAYSETTGIFDVGLEVPAGTVMALLGANGAGKTTALRILSTLLRPDRGTVRVGGIDALAQPDRVQALKENDTSLRLILVTLP
jgi:ABC-2 type transport system ATP-binding protein